MSCFNQRLDCTILIFVLLINVVLLLLSHSYIVHKSKGKSNVYMVKRNTEWGHHIVNGKLSSYDVYDGKNCHISECIDQPESTYDGVDNQICRAKINWFRFFLKQNRVFCTYFLGSMHSTICIWQTKQDDAIHPNMRIRRQMTLGIIKIIPIYCKSLSRQ